MVTAHGEQRPFEELIKYPTALLQVIQTVELWQSKQFDKLQGSHKLLPFRKWSDVSLQTEQAVREEQVRQ